MIIANKNHPSFASLSLDKYSVFVKKYFDKAELKFYSVSDAEYIATSSGPMTKAVLTNEIDNPNNDIIAFCEFNRVYYGLWEDKIWGIARDASDNLLIDYVEYNSKIWNTPIRHSFMDSDFERMTVILFEIINYEDSDE